jgi:hypothetical protein
MKTGQGFTAVPEGPLTPELYYTLMLRRALKLEVETGLHHSRGSVMNKVRSVCDSPHRTKRVVLRDYQVWLKENLGIERINVKGDPILTRSYRGKRYDIHWRGESNRTFEVHPKGQFSRESLIMIFVTNAVPAGWDEASVRASEGWKFARESIPVE